jgi:D-beta-D-heptose 7-phosphate kinase/D-beta-D-heptose 1-phosphate adenosyltransferase
MSETERKEIIEALRCVDKVVLTSHKPGDYFVDKSVVKELDLVRPDIFANGGDRHPDGDPIPEVVFCKQHTIELVYNVGQGGKVQSSSWLIEKARAKKEAQG